jgi:hypothetical protein
MPEIIGEYIDRLTTIEMRPSRGNLPRGVMHRLYEAGRERSEGPLVHRMAAALAARVSPGDHVLIMTGAGDPAKLPHSELDGLPGAVAVARALHLTLGARPVVVAEERSLLPLRATVRAAGLNPRRLADAPSANSVVLEPSPIPRDSCVAHAAALFDTLAPAALVCIEKLSPNPEGVIHDITGNPLDDTHTKPDVYVAAAADRGVLTCGIGDGGNEVGFGSVRETVADVMPAGRHCGCPCAGGNAAAVATDELLVAAISDWGGYALSAMLAFATGEHAAVVRPHEVERMIRAAVDAGAFDGTTARPTLSDDGVDLATQVAFATMLATIVDHGASEFTSPAHRATPAATAEAR